MSEVKLLKRNKCPMCGAELELLYKKDAQISGMKKALENIRDNPTTEGDWSENQWTRWAKRNSERALKEFCGEEPKKGTQYDW